MSFSFLRAAVRHTASRSLPKPQLRTSFRKFSTEASSGKSSSTALYFGLGAVVVGGGVAAYLYNSNPAGVPGVAQTLKASAKFTPTQADYQKVYNRIAELMDEADDYDDGSYGPIFLRLAWHSSGTYDKATNTGGSNFATMRFQPESSHGANNGLHVARDLMESVKKQFPWITYGDLWTLGGVAAVQEMAGPKIPWRPGRVDGFAVDATPDGRLPNAALGADHLRNIFGRMGFNDQEIVALSGGHALGRCHTDRSGFDGPWTFSPTTVTNDYYKLLLTEKWVWKDWTGPKQFVDKKTKSLMMLPTDYVLVQDKTFKKHVKVYADDMDLFFKDFAAAVSKLFELGVPASQFVTAEPWIMKTLDEQE